MFPVSRWQMLQRKFPHNRIRINPNCDVHLEMLPNIETPTGIYDRRKWRHACFCPVDNCKTYQKNWLFYFNCGFLSVLFNFQFESFYLFFLWRQNIFKYISGKYLDKFSLILLRILPRFIYKFQWMCDLYFKICAKTTADFFSKLTSYVKLLLYIAWYQRN